MRMRMGEDEDGTNNTVVAIIKSVVLFNYRLIAFKAIIITRECCIHHIVDHSK